MLRIRLRAGRSPGKCGGDCGSVLLHHALKRARQIAQQMPAICDLHGVWSAKGSAFRIRASTVAASNFDLRMGFQLGGEGGRGWLG